MSKKKKIRTEFRKNRSPRARANDWTRQFQEHGFEHKDTSSIERISGKTELGRKLTVLTDDNAGTHADSSDIKLDVDAQTCLPGRVLSVHGLSSSVETVSGEVYQCVTRRLLRTLSTDMRHVVAAGDFVQIRPSGPHVGVIERVEPRHGVLSRTSKGRQHVIVANIDLLLIVASAAEPTFKPHLADRFLVTAEKMGVEPILVINKVDLVDLASLMPHVGTLAQLGYQVYLVSVQTGLGVERLKRLVSGRQSVVAGQSGVGKTSLLNAFEPELGLRVASVSAENSKGRHTTTAARLIRFSGGYIADTPGLRQFQLWDIVPEELATLFRDFRPFVCRCKFPDCTHTREEHCGVKDAVADGLIDERRYDSYCHMFLGDQSFDDE